MRSKPQRDDVRMCMRGESGTPRAVSVDSDPVGGWQVVQVRIMRRSDHLLILLAWSLLACFSSVSAATCSAAVSEQVKCGTIGSTGAVDIVKVGETTAYSCKKCVPVGCRLFSGWSNGVLPRGRYQVAPALPGEMSFNGGPGVIMGTKVTMTCDPYYGVVHSAGEEVARSDAPPSHEFMCEANCAFNEQEKYCKPKICGDFVVPGDMTAMISSPTRGQPGGQSESFNGNNIVFGLAFDETVTLKCAAGNKLISSRLCSEDSIAFTCKDNLARFANWQPRMCNSCCTGSITVPANAKAARGRVEYSSGTLVSDFPVVITCDPKHRLDLQTHACEYEYQVKCGEGEILVPTLFLRDTRLKTSEIACVPVTCDTATARDGGKVDVDQDVHFTPHDKYKSVPFDGMALHDVSINVSCAADSYAVYQYNPASPDQFNNPRCQGMCMQVSKCLLFGRTRVYVRCACTCGM